MTYLKTAIAAAFVMATSQLASADGFYFGGGLGISDSTSDQSTNSATSTDTYATLGLTAGYRWDRPGAFFGAETDIDIGIGTDFEDSSSGASCATDADGPYYCTHDATVRLRGIVGTEVSPGLEAFGSLGVAAMQGDGAIDSSQQDTGVSTGYTVGLGLQNQLGSGMLRYELIYDNMETTATKPAGFEPTLETTSIKVTYLFN